MKLTQKVIYKFLLKDLPIPTQRFYVLISKELRDRDLIGLIRIQRSAKFWVSADTRIPHISATFLYLNGKKIKKVYQTFSMYSDACWHGFDTIEEAKQAMFPYLI